MRRKEAGAAGRAGRRRPEDDGRGRPGISTGNASQVFEPFFTTRRDMGGTGMGLAIVKTLLLAHGGQISLDEVDSGSRFRIRF